MISDLKELRRYCEEADDFRKPKPKIPKYTRPTTKRKSLNVVHVHVEDFHGVKYCMIVEKHNNEFLASMIDSDGHYVCDSVTGLGKDEQKVFECGIVALDVFLTAGQALILVGCCGVLYLLCKIGGVW